MSLNTGLWILICLSFLFFLLPLVVFFAKWVSTFFGHRYRINRRLLSRRLLLFSACLALSIFCIRFAVGYYEIALTSESESIYVIAWESITSILRSLQAFGFSEDHESYILRVWGMLSYLGGENSWFAGVFCVYTAVLNLVAPIMGGAILFEILTSVFPLVKLFFARLWFWRTKCFFSELNDRSLALATSLIENSGPFAHPVIVFTDVYTDSDDEKSSELYVKAKKLGAICISDDLTTMNKWCIGPRQYYLIDENETDNLQTLSHLSGDTVFKSLKNSEIYLFSQDDIYMTVEKQVRARLSGRFAENKEPVIIPVQRYRNLATNLFKSLPLYEPIIGEERSAKSPCDLNLTVIGAGQIGMEMILCAYWCGQMLDCKLNITVISEEDEKSFEHALDSINPDILKSAKIGDDILRYDGEGNCSDPYFHIKYYKADMNKENLSDILSKKITDTATVLDTHYFVVALGADETNISVANKLRREIGAHHLKCSEYLRTVISYVVYDAELCNTLNRERFYSYCLSKKARGADLCMHCFGSLEQMYGTENVFMGHQLKDGKKKLRDIEKKRLRDDYSHWSTLARETHVSYKVFSAGMLSKSVFDLAKDGEEKLEERRAELYKTALDKYRKKIYGEGYDASLVHRLGWLEHRRWCTFMRSRGFRCTDKYPEYFKTLGNHKHMELKLHPCLVEFAPAGINAEFDARGMIVRQKLLYGTNNGYTDLLDDVTVTLNTISPGRYDFKYYDYPVNDFDDIMYRKKALYTPNGFPFKLLEKGEGVPKSIFAGIDCVLKITRDGAVRYTKKAPEGQVVYRGDNVVGAAVSHQMEGLSCVLLADGTVRLFGFENIDLDRKRSAELVLAELSTWKDIIAVALSDALFGLSRDGKVRYLSFCHGDRRYDEVYTWSDVDKISVGRQDSVFAITNNKTVLAAGDNTRAARELIFTLKGVTDITAIGGDCNRIVYSLEDRSLYEDGRKIMDGICTVPVLSPAMGSLVLRNSKGGLSAVNTDVDETLSGVVSHALYRDSETEELYAIAIADK